MEGGEKGERAQGNERRVYKVCPTRPALSAPGARARGYSSRQRPRSPANQTSRHLHVFPRAPWFSPPTYINSPCLWPRRRRSRKSLLCCFPSLTRARGTLGRPGLGNLSFGIRPFPLSGLAPEFEANLPITACVGPKSFFSKTSQAKSTIPLPRQENLLTTSSNKKNMLQSINKSTKQPNNKRPKGRSLTQLTHHSFEKWSDESNQSTQQPEPERTKARRADRKKSGKKKPGGMREAIRRPCPSAGAWRAESM